VVAEVSGYSFTDNMRSRRARFNSKSGIRVNAVNPGLIDTQVARDVVSGDEQAYAEIAKHVPIGRAGRPEEIASVVLWLCSPGASYVVGHALTVDGGMTVA
jgi:NAD(P)-dependent dehydrogenase (short-subunit alcohol dehydrogenase family)